MNQTKKCNLEEAIEVLIEKVKSSKSKPCFISIHGHPNCGKSYLIKEFSEKALKKGIYTCSVRPNSLYPSLLQFLNVVLFHDPGSYPITVTKVENGLSPS